ncbi:atrial natriuretic peptide receptor 1-like [Paramacrobiotus metropolitanus]|uniref:atrial natriuretic peptide receptor 1-like n=1 Tax=Paramacrobiotus metropolitanus TaxID=2943436 RepID=UPI0024465195|nr:atrial natriuretic peptide receptor 1-like [Paramacrobiotus metropolitanus]
MQRLRNRTFADNFGNTMYIDSDGQRRTDFTVSLFNANGSREPLLRKFGQTGNIQELQQLLVWGSSNASFPPPNEPLCGYLKQRPPCMPGDNRFTYVLSISLVCSFGAITVLGCAVFVKRKADNQLLRDPWWQVYLEAPDQRVVSRLSLLAAQGRKPRYSLESNALRDPTTSSPSFNNAILLGSFKNKPVMGWKVLNKMDSINICQFFGLAITASTTGVYCISAVMESPSRGALPDVFDSSVSRDPTMQSSLVLDYIEAVQYVHSSSLQYHGRISVLTCWVDKHFTLKLAHLGSEKIRHNLCQANRDLTTNLCQNVIGESVYWSPPGTTASADNKSQQMVDIFSSGLVIYDILTAGNIFAKIIAAAQDSPSFPEVLDLCLDAPDIPDILRLCLSADPLQRPDAARLRREMVQINPLLAPNKKKTTLFDKIYKRLERYAMELEGQVATRTWELKEEMEKCDAIISQFLPKSVAKQLRAGEKVSAEIFESVTVLFADLYGFADFIKSSSPEMTISLIAATEAFIDRLSTECEVYKVEAVMDSFMVASGLPERIGKNHIQRMAGFVIKLMEAKHQSTFLLNLQFKIGMHSGPCAAGLMGLKRPRYCLFGDTINMASRMCSHGLPGHIHLSPHSQALLENFRQFAVESRGLQAIKGKDTMTTYWLLLPSH